MALAGTGLEHGLAAKPQQQRNRKGGGMTDAVLPEAVFTPAVAMVSANQNRAGAETLQQISQLLIYPFQASTLSPGTFHRITGLAPKGDTGTGPLGPGGTLIPVGHMSLAHIEE